MLDISAHLQHSHVLPPARLPFGLPARGAFLWWRSLWRRAMTIEIDANDLCGVSEILRQIPGDVSNEYQVDGFFGTHGCGFRPLYDSCDAPDACIRRLNDADTSRQGRVDHVTACKTTFSTDSRRHRYHLPVRKSSVRPYFFKRCAICEEDRCSARRHSEL